MDTDNKDVRNERDIEVDLFNIEESQEPEVETVSEEESPADTERRTPSPRIKAIIVGAGFLILVAGLGYLLMNYIKNNFISKEDTVIIQYQLGQINEKLEKGAAGKGGAGEAFSSQFDKLSERINELEAKITIPKNKDSEELIKSRFDQIASKIDSIEKKINALSENVTTVTEKQYYEVRRGDTLMSIARQYDLTLAKLCGLNNISPNHKIYPGQKLVVAPPLVK